MQKYFKRHIFMGGVPPLARNRLPVQGLGQWSRKRCSALPPRICSVIDRNGAMVFQWGTEVHIRFSCSGRGRFQRISTLCNVLLPKRIMPPVSVTQRSWFCFYHPFYHPNAHLGTSSWYYTQSFEWILSKSGGSMSSRNTQKRWIIKASTRKCKTIRSKCTPNVLYCSIPDLLFELNHWINPNVSPDSFHNNNSD